MARNESKLSTSIKLWLDESIDVGSIPSDIPASLRRLPQTTLYRGLALSSEEYSRLKAKRSFRIPPGSWSEHESVAHRFAMNASEEYRLILKYEASKSDVIININDACNDLGITNEYEDECEIILNEILISKKNVHSEYTRQARPTRFECALCGRIKESETQAFKHSPTGLVHNECGKPVDKK